MLRFLKALILLPVAVLVVLLAVANRGPVTLSLDPFSREAPEIAFTRAALRPDLRCASCSASSSAASPPGSPRQAPAGRAPLRARGAASARRRRLRAQAGLRQRRRSRPFRDRAPRVSDRLPPMRVVSADEIDARPDLPGAGRRPRRGLPRRHRRARPPPSRDRAGRRRGDAAADAGLDRRRRSRRFRRRQDRHRVSATTARAACRACIGTYLLMDGATGVPLAALDGTRLTLWRTAAASALAARYLARADAAPHGDGRRRRARAVPHPRASEPAADPARSRLWNHRPGARRGARRELSRPRACRSTAAERPRGRGARGRPRLLRHALDRAPRAGRLAEAGAHLDLVGAFNLRMREADDEALRRASVFVDTTAPGREGGDVAVDRPAARRSRPLADLCRGGPGAAGETSVDRSA